MALPTCECMPGLTPSIGDKLDAIYCVLYTIYEGGGFVGQSSIAQFADEAARLAATPTFAGQLGYQADTASYYTALSTGVGDWSGNFTLGGGTSAGTLALMDSSLQKGALVLDTLSADRVYLLPDTAGTIDVTP